MDVEMERAKAMRGSGESEYGMLLLRRRMDLEPGTRSAVQGTHSIRIHKYDGWRWRYTLTATPLQGSLLRFLD